MRAFYIPAGLLAVILGCSLWAGRYVELRTEAWSAQLEAAAEAAAREDWPRTEEILQRAFEDWDRDQTFFHTIIDHDELDEAEQDFRAVLASCRQQDGGEVLFQLAELTGQLKLIADTQTVSIRNIF